ncbi:MAG: TetR/AcrR family transcriptional regulator [candidate division Zixibacteria bacterium]|nr:TetR/AcrR family transcriptional regulator [candidate division Zixibacteria bacterium]
MRARPRDTVPAINENTVAELVQQSVVTDTFRRLVSDKKQRLYQTTIRLFGEYGYDGLSVDQFCREAGISKGSFFQYFPSKSHLLEFAILIFDDYLKQLLSEIRRTEPGPLVKQKLLHLYEALIVNARLYRAEERFYLFATRALDHSAVALEGIDLERHVSNYVEEIIRRGEETGEIRGDFDIELTGRLVSLVMGTLVRSTFRADRLPRQETERYLISFLFDGIKA